MNRGPAYPAPRHRDAKGSQKRRSKGATHQLKATTSRLQQHQRRKLPKSPLGEATSYARSNWTALTRYTEQGYLSLDTLPQATTRSKAPLCEETASGR
ncbi:MAG: hypothetical protein ICCCNLDF_03626 [Planctomycetes bacterium]|nr:hypothetical protein [Planctomycetota bacterium]